MHAKQWSIQHVVCGKERKILENFGKVSTIRENKGKVRKVIPNTCKARSPDSMWCEEK